MQPAAITTTKLKKSILPDFVIGKSPESVSDSLVGTVTYSHESLNDRRLTPRRGAGMSDTRPKRDTGGNAPFMIEGRHGLGRDI